MKKRYLGIWGKVVLVTGLMVAMLVSTISYGEEDWHQGLLKNGQYDAMDITPDGMKAVARSEDFGRSYDDYVNIKREEHPDKGTIDWEVDFMPKGNIWSSRVTSAGGIKHVVFLPHMQDDTAKSLEIHRTIWNRDQGKGSYPIHEDNLNVGNLRKPGVNPFHESRRWRSEDNGDNIGSTNYFDKNYEYLNSVFKTNKNHEIYDTAVFWRRHNILQGVGDGKYGTFRYCLNAWMKFSDTSATWKFTTHHGKGTDLSKVVLIAGVRDYGAGEYGSQHRHFRISGPMGVGAIASMDMTRDVYVDDPFNLTQTEQDAIQKTVREDTYKKTKQLMDTVGGLSSTTYQKVLKTIQDGKITYDFDRQNHKVIAKMNLRYTMKNGDGRDVQFNQPIKLDITNHLKLKRLVIPGSEGIPKEFTGANGEDVQKEYVKAIFNYDNYNGGKLTGRNGKAEQFYYVRKDKEIPELTTKIPEKATLDNRTFLHWSWSQTGEERTKDALKPQDKIFYKGKAKALESQNLYAIYKPILKIVLHNCDTRNPKTKEIIVTKDMFQDNKGYVPIDQPYYSTDTPGTLGDDFKRNGETFVGWTIEENLNPPFGDHLVDNANQSSVPKEKQNVYTLKQLEEGRNLRKVNGKFVNPPYLPSGFKLVLEGDLNTVAQAHNGVINLYANYKPYIKVTAEKSFKKYDWTKKTYSEFRGDKPPVYMGLVYRTYVTDASDPTVHTDANYHPLKARDYGQQDNEEGYKQSVLKQYTGSNTPEWEVPGYDEFGVRLSYALVEVPDEYLSQYMHFSNNWQTLGVQIFHHKAGGQTEINPNAPLDPWDQNKQVAKLQTVSIPHDGKVDIFSAATTRESVLTGNGDANDIKGYKIKVVNIPVELANPNVDAITHGDKEVVIHYKDNRALGAKNVDTIKVKYTPHDKSTAWEYDLVRQGDKWIAYGVSNSPKFKAEWRERNGDPHGAVVMTFVGNTEKDHFYCVENGGSDTMTVRNLIKQQVKTEVKSNETQVHFELLRDANKLDQLTQLKNVTENGIEYTVVSARLPSPVLSEAKQGTIFTLVSEEDYKLITQGGPTALEKSALTIAKSLRQTVEAQKGQSGNDGYHFKRNIQGDTYYLKEPLAANKTIQFKIPKGKQNHNGQEIDLHHKTFYVLTIEDKKKPTFSIDKVTLDTKAEIEKAEVLPSPGDLRATIKATISQNENVTPEHKLKVSYLGKTYEYSLNGREFTGTSIAPLGQEITVTYIDFFGNKATRTVKGGIGEYITLGVVQPRRYSPYVYVNRKADSTGASVTVTVLRDTESFVLNEVKPGRFKMPNGQRLMSGDIVDVRGTLGDKKTYPYRVKVR